MNRDALTIALARFILELERLTKSTHYAEDRHLYETFLANVSIIIARVVQEEPIGDDIASMDWLFGHTWFRDKDAYGRAYSQWDIFKGLLTQSIHGMTVNERLFVLGLLDEFDDAVACGNEPQLRKILSKCFLGEENIEAIVVQQLRKK